MLSKYDMIILINDYQKLRYGNLQESMLCSRKERKRGRVKALFFIVMAIGWILGTILDEMLSQRGIFALIFAILAPVYVLYLQIEAELAEMRGEKGGEEKSTDVQKLFSRTLQECAAAFHEGEYNEHADARGRRAKNFSSARKISLDGKLSQIKKRRFFIYLRMDRTICT